MLKHHIFLVPGFFGFANFGDFKYFAHVRDHLERWAQTRGVEVEVHYAPTYPTASLRRRAGRLVEVIAQHAAHDEGAIHLVGHSTGGLDARLAVAPGASLVSAVDPEPYSARVRSVVAVSSPHYGAPTAAFFTSLLGQRLLFLLSLTTIHAIRLGTIPLPVFVVLASALGSAGGGRLVAGGVIEQVYDLVLKDFDRKRRVQIEGFFEEVRRDQTLLVQLTPEGMDVVNALATQRSGIRCGCVVSQARPPSYKGNLRMGINPTHQAMYGVYRGLYQLASTLPDRFLPEPSPSPRAALVEAFGSFPTPETNDAMVPVLSQVWGDVVHAAWADHLDVIGHLDDRDHTPIHVDWMRSARSFRRPHFERMWDSVMEYMITA